jgi:TfoX/Sxy family transcriptional regulator of competence genes
MGWKKVPVEHVEAFEAALPAAPGVEQRKMFGCPAGFVNGNMFCGAHETSILVRLDAKSRERALQEPGFAPFRPMGREMKQYVCLPEERLTDVAYLRRWFKKALAYASTLPAKEKKSPARSGRKKAGRAKP